MLQDLQIRGIYLTENDYWSGIRKLFPEDYDRYTDDQLEDIIYDKIATLSPSEAESFVEGFGDFLKKDKSIHISLSLFVEKCREVSVHSSILSLAFYPCLF